MKKLSYLERRTQDQAEMSKDNAVNLAAQNKLQLQSDLLATQRALMSERDKLESLKSAEQLSGADLVSKMDDVESLEKGEKALKVLIGELFLNF